MDDVVREMHTRQACSTRSQASTVTLDEAGEQTLAFIKAHVPERGPCRCAATRSAPTAASSPRTCRRSRSTSTTDRSTCRRSRSWPDAGIPACCAEAPDKAGAHRALDDIRESIAELRYYREHVFSRRLA